MTRKEIQAKFEEQQRLIEDLQEELNKIKGMSKATTDERFRRGKEGEEYFILNHKGEVFSFPDTFNTFDNECYDSANYCFDKNLIEKRATEEVLSRLIWREAEIANARRTDEGKDRYYIAYDPGYKKFVYTLIYPPLPGAEGFIEWKDARLHELLGDNLTVGWKATFTKVYGEKCDKCDEDRMIHFTSPQGRDFSERCECAKCYRTYFPEEVALYKFHVSKRENWPYNKKVDYYNRYYKAIERDDYHEYCESVSEVYTSTDNINYERVNECWAVFLNKEDCQKFCDWKNKQELKK